MRRIQPRERPTWTQRYLRFEQMPGRLPEMAALALYVVLLCVVSAFHEPWFDEAQAWQIAKCAPIRDILFSIPHYEGHPPLWHLLLSLPAKLGAPYEWSIKSLNILLCAAAVCLLLFFSPFSRSVRLALPFTYFLFYQYGAIARPYSVLFLAFVLAAAAYPARDHRPFRYALSLMLLCATSAYGIVFAGGLALVRLIELCAASGWRVRRPAFARDRRMWALGLLLVFALASILMILPRKDAYAISATAVQNSFPVRLIYTSFILPADACFFDCFRLDASLAMEQFDPAAFAAGVAAGLLFWVVLLILSRQRKHTLLLVVPYALFAGFSALVYFSQHHIGVVSLFLLFWFWVDAASPESESQPPQTVPVDPREERRAVLRADMRRTLRVFCAVLILSVSLIWTIFASLHDIANVYGFGREAAAVIKARQLEDRSIFCSWGENENRKTGELTMDTNYSGGVTVLPYFRHNIISNLNQGDDRLAFVTHRRADEAVNRANLRAWAERGAPDVLLGLVDLQVIFGDKVTMQDYAPIASLQHSMIWKLKIFSAEYSIYQRID